MCSKIVSGPYDEGKGSFFPPRVNLDQMMSGINYNWFYELPFRFAHLTLASSGPTAIWRVILSRILDHFHIVKLWTTLSWGSLFICNLSFSGILFVNDSFPTGLGPVWKCSCCGPGILSLDFSLIALVCKSMSVCPCLSTEWPYSTAEAFLLYLDGPKCSFFRCD